MRENLPADMAQKFLVVLLKKFAHNIRVSLWTFTFVLRLKLEPRRFERMQFLATLFAFPKFFTAQTGLVRFQFAEQTFHRFVERSNEIGPGFFAVQNIRGNT